MNTLFKRDRFQEKVIAIQRDYHLVLAPPGCGKTKILAERVVHALERGIPLSDMLCLTFTNRAAREMRQRIARTLHTDTDEELFVGNVHRFCSQFLFSQNVIPKGTSILDETGTVTLIQGLMKTQETGHYDTDKRELFTRITGLHHLAQEIRYGLPRRVWLYDRLLYDTSLRELFRQLGKPLTPENFERFYRESDKIKFHLFLSREARHTSDLITLARCYELQKEENDFIDFDDLLLLTYTYAAGHTDEIRKYTWIQIDEVQDLSPLQFAIVDCFTDTAVPFVTLYLGDEQQAIFSFIGAKTSTMGWLKERCQRHIHQLQCNYRSPSYLLKLFNEYAECELQVDPDFLPHADNKQRKPAGALLLNSCDSEADEPLLVTHLIQQLRKKYPEENIAVLVPWNKHADTLSEVLSDQGLRHFKISGTDIFTQPPMQLLCAHMEVVSLDTNYAAWSKVLYYAQIFTKPSAALSFTQSCKYAGVVPSDFICYPDSSFLLEMEKLNSGAYVLLDTESTGNDVLHDDIVEVTALRICQGEVTVQFDLLLPTDRPLPAVIDDIENPLLARYAEGEKTPRAEGLRQLVEFIGQAPIVGHNINFDLDLLRHNLERDTDIDPEVLSGNPRFDTLKATRILFPKQESYRLASLAETFHLNVQVAHLSAGDAHVTHQLFNVCLQQFARLKSQHLRFLSKHRPVSLQVEQRYGPIFLRTVRQLYHTSATSNPILVNELLRLYNHFVRRQWIDHLPKMRYIFRYLHDDIVDSRATPRLIDQLQAHLVDLTTYREADLCESSAIQEKIFISTVHKAKGLEFQSVILYGANEGYYPFFSDTSEEEFAESARLFYVGMSRAQKRLYLTYAHARRIKTAYGRTYTHTSDPTRFLDSILHYFTKRHYDSYELEPPRTLSSIKRK